MLLMKFGERGISMKNAESTLVHRPMLVIFRSFSELMKIDLADLYLADH